MAQQAELPMKDVTPQKAKKNDPAQEAQKAPAKNEAKAPAKGKKASKEVAVATPSRAAVAVENTGKSVLQIIAEAAANPAVNPENMRALLDMQKEIVAEERRMAFDAAFIALQAELPVVNKDGRIEIREKDGQGGRTGRIQQATPYATFEAIMDVIQPLLTKHGFGLSFETEPVADRLLVRGRLKGHGHESATAFPLPAETSGSKNNVQGWGSSMSYGKRYCTIALLNIRSRAIQDRDTDGHEGRFQPAKGNALAQRSEDRPCINKTQAHALWLAMEGAGLSEAKFIAHYGIRSVQELPADLFDSALKRIADHKAVREKKESANG